MKTSIYWNQIDYIININMRLVKLPLPRQSHYVWQGDAAALDEAHQALINTFYIQSDITRK